VVYSFEARAKLSALLREYRPSIVHAHNIYHHISPSILGLLRKRGVPTVLTLHDLKIACPAYQMLTHDGVCERCKGRRYHNVIKHRCVKGSAVLSAVIFAEAAVHDLLGSYRCAVDKFVVPSRFYIEKLVEWGWPRDRFAYIPNFVDADAYPISEFAGSAFLYMGRLAPEKGLRTLIRAVALARVELWIAGAGAEEPALRKLAGEVNANVTFHGRKNQSDLQALVGRCRAVVLASEWYENAPMSVMESFAMERPVVGAAIGGIPEMVQDGVTGMTFKSGDVHALAGRLQAMARLTAHQVAEMGRAGRALVLAEFSRDRHRQRLMDVYRTLGVAAPGAT
jgi:glycosyltransferase involved in cell wall biosynthesis